MQGRKEYQEKLFMQFQLSDYVPADNFYRQLKSVLDLSFLYQSTATYYGKEGQKSIDPVVFMKLMLVGYIENIHSDRRIVSNAKMRLDILYFLGYDLDEELPWHSTLSRTRKLYGEDQFMAIFKLVLKLCIDRGLISGKRQAVDSALIRANASMEKMIEKEIMEDAETYQKELDVNAENELQATVVPIPKPVTAGTNKRYRKISNQTHYSKTDPDARLAGKPGKPVNLYYRSQVSVDTASYFITHIQAFHTVKMDNTCLPEVVAHTVANLNEQGLQVKEILADGAYASGEAFQSLVEQNIEGYIPNPLYKSQREGFTYDAGQDRFTCSRGVHITFKCIAKHQNVYRRAYRSRKEDCSGCPFLKSCACANGYKLISLSIHHVLHEAMHQRMNTPGGKRMVRQRHATVEPVIGSLVNYNGMNRINPRGLPQANKCMIMAAVAYNLKKYLKTKTSLAQSNLASLEIKEKMASVSSYLPLVFHYIQITVKIIFNQTILNQYVKELRQNLAF